LGEFITAPGKTNRARDEILTGVLFPQRRNAHRQGSGYIKLANRKSLEISVVGAAGWVEFDETGTVSAARIALGAVAPTPLEVKEAGQALIGKKLDREAITEASRIAASIAKPITDHRGSREYRSRMVEVLVRRVLNQCESDAFGEGSR
jgi:carbon-monoxide dehydrogenase medium subunit